MRKKIYKEDPEKWIETGGKGKLIPSGNIKKAQKKDQKKFDQIHRDMFQEKIHDNQEEIKGLLKNQEAPPPKGLKGFSWWAGTDSQIELLFQELKDKGYIAQNTYFKTFTDIFSGSLAKCKPLQWRCFNREIVYLFSQLDNYNLLSTHEWQSIIGKYKLFINKKGNFMKANDLSSALTEINKLYGGELPKRYYKIDKILRNL